MKKSFTLAVAALFLLQSYMLCLTGNEDERALVSMVPIPVEDFENSPGDHRSAFTESDAMGGSWYNDFMDESGLDLINNVTTGSGATLSGPLLPIYPDCKAYFRMNEGLGNKTLDHSANGNDGLVLGSGWVEGKYGNALEFDGAGNHVDLSGKTIANQANENRTILAWVKTTKAGGQVIISTGTPNNNQAFNFVIGYGGQPGVLGVMGYFNDYYPASSNRVDDGKWHHVGVTYNGTNVTTFVDGILDNSIAKTYSTAGQVNYIGKSNHPGFEFYFKGEMDELSIYNRSMTAQEVYDIYGETINTPKYFPAGQIISKEIQIADDMLWRHLSLNKTMAENTSLDISIVDAFTNVTLPGFENIDPEHTDLSSLNTPGIASIRLRANVTGNGSASPILNFWGIEWQAPNAWRDAFTGKSKSVFSNEFELVNSSVVLGSNELLPTNDMVSLWHFNEGAGTGAKDEGSSGNDGTLNGAQWSQDGVYGSNLVFNGATSYVATDLNLVNWLGGTATLVAWVKTTAVGHGTFWQAPGIAGIEQAGGGNDIFWGWMDNAGRIGMMTGNAAGAKSSAPINDGQWHHIALTRHSGTGRCEVYVDGKLSNARNSETGQKTLPFRSIGRIEDSGGTPAYFNGQLDDVAIFGRVLDPVEIGRLSWKMPFQTTLRSETVDLPDNQTWTGFSFSRFLPENTYVNISVHDGVTGALLKSDTGLLPTGNIDLSDLNSFETKSLYFGARFQSNVSTSPLLLDWGVNWTQADPPVLIKEIPDVTILEDSPRNNLLDISAYFGDAYAKFQAPAYDVEYISDPDNISFRIISSQLDVIDLGDNFTGTITVKVNCTNALGMVARSNPFNITVEEVNDAPVWISNFPEIHMDEYSEMTTNWSLLDYVFDVEGDELNFSVDPLDYPMQVDITPNMQLRIKALANSWGNGIFNLRVFENGNFSIGSNTTHAINIKSVNPPLISLLSPKDNITLGDTETKFEWFLFDPGNKLGNIRYDLHLGLTPDPPLHTAGISVTSLNISGLEANSTYYWNVVPRFEGAIEECRSDTWQFAINTALGIPEIALSSPEDNTLFSQTNVSLLWQLAYLSPPATDFKVYLGRSEDDLEMINSTPFPQYRLSGLSYNTTYYWTVVPFNGTREGTCLNGIWSFSIAPEGVDLTPKLELYFSQDEVILKKAGKVTLNLTVKNMGYFPVTTSLEVVGELLGFATLSQHTDLYIEDQISVLITLEWTPSFLKNKYELQIKAVYSGMETTAGIDIEIDNEREGDDSGTVAKNTSDNCLWIIIPIIILLILLIIIFIIVRKKRKDRKEKEGLAGEIPEKKGGELDQKKLEAEKLYSTEKKKASEKKKDESLPGAGVVSDAQAMSYFDDIDDGEAVLMLDDIPIEVEVEYTPPPSTSMEKGEGIGSGSVIVDAELVDAEFEDIPVALPETSGKTGTAPQKALPPGRPGGEGVVIMDAEIISESIDDDHVDREIDIDVDMGDVEIVTETIDSDEVVEVEDMEEIKVVEADAVASDEEISEKLDSLFEDGPEEKAKSKKSKPRKKGRVRTSGTN